MSWWQALSDDWLADQLLARSEEDEAREVDFLVRRLDLAPGARVFDQCCGIGSLALPLAARGMRVVGVDQSAAYVERAERQARTRGVSASFVVGDARAFVPAERTRAAFNWWTSFGYAEDDRDNARVLERAFDALEPGGRFALDTMNVPGVLRGFQRDRVRRRTTARGEVLLLRESELDLAAGAMRQRWSYFVGGALAVEHASVVRLYMPDAIARMLRGAGFADVELLGSTGGESLALDSPRLIAVARRPP